MKIFICEKTDLLVRYGRLGRVLGNFLEQRGRVILPRNVGHQEK